MQTLPLTMNVNWYIVCTGCKHNQFVSVDWFKDTRAKYGKDKPLTWNRLVCKKCGGRKITLTRRLPETRQQFAARRDLEIELEAARRFEAKLSEWSDSSSWDGSSSQSEEDRERSVYDYYYVDGVKVG